MRQVQLATIAAPSSPRLSYVPALDGLRGVAIAAVIAHHFFGLQGGFFGVDVFFVLSGFLITTLLLDERVKRGSVSLRGFYCRRARRLLPALGALLVFSGVLAYGDPAQAWMRAEGIASTVFYSNNFDWLVRHRMPGELSQNWSLSQEEQFYVIWPGLLLLALRRAVGLRTLARLLLVAAIVAAAWRVILVFTFGVSDHVYFGPDTRMDGLLLGCAFAVARHAGIVSDRAIRQVSRFSLAALAAIAASTVVFSKGATLTYVVGLPVVELATVVLIVSALAGSRLLALRPLVWLGATSYSLYLWQGFGAIVGAGAVGAGVAFVAAMLSYRFIESPFRRGDSARVEPAATPLAATTS